MAGKQLQRSIILSVGMAFFLSSARVWGSHESPLVPMLRSQNRRRRHLQAIEGALPVCNTSGAVNFDIDEPHYIIFASEFEPVCSCDEGTCFLSFSSGCILLSNLIHSSP